MRFLCHIHKFAHIDFALLCYKMWINFGSILLLFDTKKSVLIKYLLIRFWLIQVSIRHLKCRVAKGVDNKGMSNLQDDNF